MEQYWFCPDDRSKLQLYASKYSGDSNFVIRKGKIDISLSNAVAVKKIEPNSITLGKQLAQEYFNQFPEAEELECIGTICGKCNKIYASPKHITTSKLGEIDLNTYKYWGPFRVPVAEREERQDNDNYSRYYLMYYFRYYLYAYILNYTLFIQMKLFGRYRGVGYFFIFPILFVFFVVISLGQGSF